DGCPLLDAMLTRPRVMSSLHSLNCGVRVSRGQTSAAQDDNTPKRAKHQPAPASYRLDAKHTADILIETGPFEFSCAGGFSCRAARPSTTACPAAGSAGPFAQFLLIKPVRGGLLFFIYMSDRPQ